MSRENHNPQLGDFTASPRVLFVSVIAILIGFIATWVALALLRLIGLFTNLFFYGRFGTALVSPAGNRLGWWEILIPIGGGLIVGLMARYGSDRIRGHGIPEAIESILINGSRVPPRLAILKPLSAAIAIGTGGPFGAEGPIIMTGGAFGSLIAQLFRLTGAERKTLLVAGAAAGMSATFAAPIASVLLAVEILLFEWKPRSLIPVALASATAAAGRRYILGLGPLFPVPAHPAFIGAAGLAGCALCGVLAGGLAALLTMSIYAAEDGFQKLPIHWMWWPAIGGLVVGIGGLLFPQALGVGYDTIGALLKGDVPRTVILGVLLVKSTIWAVSLGSGTSGGVLAPLLMMGGALGGIEAMFLPFEGAGFWPLVSMAAVLGGTMRAPFTAIIFALELTHDINMLLPLLIAGSLSYAFTVLLLKRSILTEKVARRGFHLTAEYAVDPLEVTLSREVMRTRVAAFLHDNTVGDVRRMLRQNESPRGQHLYPILDADSRVVGVITRRDVLNAPEDTAAPLLSIGRRNPVVAWTDEPLRVVVYRMSQSGYTRMPVLDRQTGGLAGMISLEDMLRARTRTLGEEAKRERVLQLRMPFGRRQAQVVADTVR